MLTGPALVMFVGFVIFPVVMAAYYGFFSWQGYGPPTDFVGLRNYLTILQDSTFLDAVKHNAVIVVLSLVLQGPVAIALALLLNRKMRGQSLSRVLIFVPYVISEVVVGTGLEPDARRRGRLQRPAAQARAGQAQPGWISDPRHRDLDPRGHPHLEVRRVRRDPVPRRPAGHPRGADARRRRSTAPRYWQIQRRITLPLLGPTIRIWAFLSIIGALQLFDLVYIIWGQYIASTAGTFDDGDLHGAQRPDGRELRVRQRRRRACCSSSHSPSPWSTSGSCCDGTPRARSPEGVN